MKLLKNIKSGIRTTIAGLLFLISGFSYLGITLYKEININEMILLGLLGTGFALLFFPDTFISKIKAVFDKYLTKKAM